jgi:hypothetical protein
MGMLAATFFGLRSLRIDRIHADAGRLLSADPDPAMVRKLRADILFMRDYSAALAIGIVGYLVSGAFLSVLFYPGLPLFAALVQAAVEAWRTEMTLAAAVAGRGADEEAEAEETEEARAGAPGLPGAARP